MSKTEFLDLLRKGLSGLPQSDIEERVSFYAEIIDDRTEEGLSEDEAVSAVGTVDEIVAQVIEETPLAKIAKERIRAKRRMKAWEVVLIVLGSPIWLSLGVAAAAVIFSVYVALWSVIISLWAAFASFVCSAFGGVVAGIVFVCTGNAYTGIAMVGASLVLAGLSVFMYFGCKSATKGIVLLTEKLALWTKNCFIRKGEA